MVVKRWRMGILTFSLVLSVQVQTLEHLRLETVHPDQDFGSQQRPLSSDHQTLCLQRAE